ncbi:MAG: tRNA lysidine(34) synthetase TilS [Marinilabiliaceae bacterium]
MKINTGVIDRGRPVLVAISGGADSVALLHILVTAGYDCVAAHCNFHLRGADSDSDESFVRTFCGGLGVPLRVAQFDTLAYAARRKVSIEMAARELRYDWFFSILDETDIPVVAVAHHADDAAETFLLNLTRGTGLRGLAGMKTVQGRVVRPMLGVSRREVELYCQTHGLSFVTDCTNNSDDYARNRIRHHVISELKALNPSFLTTMGRNMAHLSQVLTFFEAQVDSFRQASVSQSDGGLAISADGLSSLSEPEPFVFEILAPLGFSPKSIHDVARCFAERRFGRLFFAPGWRVVVDRSGILACPLTEGVVDESVVVESCPAQLSSPLRVEVAIWPKPEGYAFSRDPFVMHLDADKVALPLTFRRWRRGDAFRPLGMKGEKKLSDFFVDCKLSRPQKESAWVAEAGGKIVCVLGMRIDDRVKVSPQTTNILEIKYTR